MTTQAAESTGLVTRTLHPAITTDAGSFEAAARAAERVTVCLERPGPEFRTRLLTFVLTSIERQLEQLGAAPSGCTARDSLETILSDQLYRSRLLGAGGIALRFAALDGIADETEGLSVEDSHALRRMFALAELEPLQVFLPEPSARLGVLGAPQRLSDWLPIASTAGRVASIEYEAMAAEPSGAVQAAPSPPSLAPPELEAFVNGLESPTSPAPLAAEASRSESPVVAPLAAPVAPRLEEAPPLDESAGLDENERPTVVPGLAPADPMAAAAPATAAAAAALSPAPQQVDAAGELEEQHQRRCAAWLAQLQSMNGPKVHASVERAFLTAYLPLAREMACGKASREIRDAVESWAEGFAQSYAAAFKTLSSHARRPTMVRDIFEVGQRWLNQYRARSCQLLLVDGMRFDLGQRLNEEIERRLAGHAVCRDQTLLWAALPSNSGAQRLGEASAKRAQPSNSGTAPDAVGSASSAVESLRVGSRELFRVDRLSADLTRPGELEPQRLERLAILLADAVVPWLKARGPDVLIVVFGDHGFHWQASERGTSAAQRGGALPEQVLVPASAWLLGGTRPKAGLAPGVH